MQWRATIGGMNARICGGQLTLGSWHHVAGTYDGNAFVLYVDGFEVASVARSGSIAMNSSDLIVGNHPTWSRPFDGGIDEVRIWDIARTQQEIQDNINVELTGSEPGLVAYYDYNAGTGQTVFDGTANGNDGTLGSTTGTDTDDPAWASSDYYVAAGNSITIGSQDNILSDGIGYEPILADFLTVAKGYSHTVVNEGVSGDTSALGLALMPSLLSQHPGARFFLVQYGTNDAKTAPPTPSGIGLSSGHPDYPGTFKDNMHQIIALIKSSGRIPYLAKVPKAFGSFDPINSDLQEYNQVIDELDSENGIGVMPPDFFSFFESHPEQMADDLHPDGVGYQSMARLWRDAIMNPN